MPLSLAGCDTRTIFKWSTAGLNSEFSFSQTSYLTKPKEPSLSYYLPIATKGRRDGFMPFWRALVQNETQTATSRIWTQVIDSIYYKDNQYATSASLVANITFTKPMIHIDK